MTDQWTQEQTELPLRLLEIMEACEYHIACADAPAPDRMAALDEVISWCHDQKVTITTGIPMADSDMFPARVEALRANQTATRA